MSKAPSRALRMFRYAMYFDGRSSYVAVSHSDSLMPPQMSSEAWFCPRDYSTVHARILEKGGCGIGGGYGLEFNPQGLQAQRFVIWRGTTFHAIDSQTRISSGVWWHVVGTFDGSTAKLYINRILEGSRSADMSSNTAILAIGRAAYGAANFLPGYINAVRIYSRALTAGEIAWNYSYPNNPIKDGLVLWLHAHPDNIKDIDGDGVLEWVDLSGFNNHGKIYGATLVEVIKAPSHVLAPSRILPPAR